MRTKFKMSLIETERDFSVYEILTKKGEPAGYNAEAVKYYDGGVNYWKIRNTRTNMWKRCESEKELFSTLEKIKSDSAYARKFGEILPENHAEKHQKIGKHGKKAEKAVSVSTPATEDSKKKNKDISIFNLIFGFLLIAAFFFVIFTAHIWGPIVLKIFIAACVIGALASIPIVIIL